ncbi:MAG TPA: twin-arginine translocase subunit TatC [Terriglobia bacterium]|nr:twin-arginine translocase subunit TatC [Terriglobia bacterium]
MPTDRDEELEQQEEELSGQMSFFDHLGELRRRILNSLIAVGVAFAACWYFADEIFNVFRRLIDESGAKLNQPEFTDAFTVQLKMALMAAIFLASPFILAQVWLFISPGLYRRERRYAGPFVVSATILFVLGGLFAYYIALPTGLKFLIDMGKGLEIETLISVSSAFNLVFALIVGMGVVFEIPALIFLLSRIGIVSGPFLLRNMKYAVLGCFVAAAIITPTGDIGNMMILAIPMLGLYVVGILVAYIFGKKRRRD